MKGKLLPGDICTPRSLITIPQLMYTNLQMTGSQKWLVTLADHSSHRQGFGCHGNSLDHFLPGGQGRAGALQGADPTPHRCPLFHPLSSAQTNPPRSEPPFPNHRGLQRRRLALSHSPRRRGHPFSRKASSEQVHQSGIHYVGVSFDQPEKRGRKNASSEGTGKERRAETVGERING